MTSLIDTLSERRKSVAARGARIAEVTRDRGLETLSKVRSGALDWHRTLEARRAHLDASGAQPGWLKLDGFQIFVLDRVDRVLVAFGDRVREEIARLGRLELGEKPKKAPKKKAGTAERRTSPAKKAGPTKKASPAQKKPSAKRSATRRLVMPIADYDSLTAKQVLAELGGLSAAQRKGVRTHEAANKKRKTVLRALDALG